MKAAGFPFESISSGKLRRYVSLSTLIEPFRVYAGYRQAKTIIKRFKPDVVFSKGGSVAVPVVRAAHRLNVPSVLHESDLVPGLANKIGGRWAQFVAVSFPPEHIDWKPAGTVVHTGNPLRAAASRGSAARAITQLKLDKQLPTVLVLGGSQGSTSNNRAIGAALSELLPEAQVIHQTGEGKEDQMSEATAALSPDLAERYHPRGSFFGEEQLYYDVLAAADIVVSRSGANTLAEIAIAGKPSILVPHEAGGSGHQAANAEVFAEAQAAVVLTEAAMAAEDELTRAVKKLLHDPSRRSQMGRAAKSLACPTATKEVADLVWQVGEGSDVKT